MQGSIPGALKVLRSIPAAVRWGRRAPRPLVLVPTMGALHAGHGALLDHARRSAGSAGAVVASIFVNPSQFGPNEDFSRYPRSFAADRELCAGHKADAIFHPEAAAMYAADYSTWVNEEVVSSALCGRARPGHFRGVCTVVLKLFSILQPEIAVFGRKDFQQCAVIARMVRDLNLPVRLVFAPTVREPDGLAMSSRNAYLGPEERQQAPVLKRALLEAQAVFRGGTKSAAKLRAIVLKTLAEAPRARVDYVEVFHARTLEPVERVERGCVIALAIFFGTTRLIDNLELR